MELTNIVIELLSILTLIGDIFIVGFLIYFIFYRKKYRNEFLQKNAMLFAFLTALLATVGSLFMSEIAGYSVCKLCWYQRIFIYPQTIILGIALVRKARNIFYYTILLNIVGGIIAVYHYVIQRMNYLASCAIDEVSCSVQYIFSFGYMTIPIMALTTFILMAIFTYLWKENNYNPYTRLKL